MKKRVGILSCILCALVFFPSFAHCAEGAAPRRGLFVSMIQDSPVLASRADIDRLVDFAKSHRISILFVQVYRANEAYFPSRFADTAPYRAAVKKLSEDPFRILIKEAHRSGIEVHAWLNMLSLGENKNAFLLKKYGTSVLTRNRARKFRIEDYRIDEQYFLEPGDLRVRQDLSAMVVEVLKSYPELDGIQFDYLRYPDEKPFYGHTKSNIERFKKATGLKAVREEDRAWKDWKRAQVTEFMELVVGKARSIRPHIQVSATGCMPYSRAYHEAFQDWPSWLDRGLVDFVTVMNYSPFAREFEEWISVARTKTKNFKKVNIAVGAYKLLDSPDVFKQELRLAEKADGFACTIFHYGSLVQRPGLANFLVGGRIIRGR